jgi:hypothetical protein
MTEYRHILAGLALGLALMLPLAAAVAIGTTVLNRSNLGRIQLGHLTEDRTK